MRMAAAGIIGHVVRLPVARKVRESESNARAADGRPSLVPLTLIQTQDIGCAGCARHLLPSSSQMKNSKVLIMESNQDLRGILALLLGRYVVVSAGSIDEAEEALRRESFDLAILDVASGSERSPAIRFIQALRHAGEHLPIIATSAIAGPGVAVKALGAGSDDFLRKPWRSDELLARVDRQIRRLHERGATDAEKANGTYLHGEFLFGGARVGSDLMLRFGAKETRLMAKQYAMLWVFHRHAGRLVTRETLRREVWGPATNAGALSMTEYLSRLRKSFRSLGLDFDRLVQTQSGLGYRVSAMATSSEGQ